MLISSKTILRETFRIMFEHISRHHGPPMLTHKITTTNHNPNPSLQKEPKWPYLWDGLVDRTEGAPLGGGVSVDTIGHVDRACLGTMVDRATAGVFFFRPWPSRSMNMGGICSIRCRNFRTQFHQLDLHVEFKYICSKLCRFLFHGLGSSGFWIHLLSVCKWSTLVPTQQFLSMTLSSTPPIL